MDRSEAIRRIREWNLDSDDMEVLGELIPELKESEDERIRKVLYGWVYTMPSSNFEGGFSREEILSWLDKQGSQNLANSAKTCKVEPKFKVKYAGGEYNVFETKELAGVTFYGIEDEPNHIDYVKAESCEIIGGYTIKENGSPYPTNPAVFSEQNPAWSEEDEIRFESTLHRMEIVGNGCAFGQLKDDIEWFKSLKERCTWKPSDEQMKALGKICEWISLPTAEILDEIRSLYNELKKLKG